MSDDTFYSGADSDQAAAPPELVTTATSETSWMITTPAGNAVIGHVTQGDDVFTAYDAQELRIGDYPTRDDAVNAIATGTR